MDFVRIDGVLLACRLAGPAGAPAVVLVNSLGTDARIWDAVIARLVPHYRVLSYDKRGHGLSDAPHGDYSLDQHLDDLEGLLDHAGIDRFALCGVSVGGLIAQGYALRAPGRLTALMLCDTAPKIGDAALWAARMAGVEAHGMASLADAVMERWFTHAFRQGRPDDLAGWRNLFLRSDPGGYVSTCATLRDTDLRAAIAAIATPTLVVCGAEDRSTPPELVRSCAEAIAGARFQLLPETGHLPSIEQPEALAALMRQFFKECGHG